MAGLKGSFCLLDLMTLCSNYQYSIKSLAAPPLQYSKVFPVGLAHCICHDNCTRCMKRLHGHGYRLIQLHCHDLLTVLYAIERLRVAYKMLQHPAVTACTLSRHTLMQCADPVPDCTHIQC